jgi:hypothetical protein
MGALLCSLYEIPEAAGPSPGAKIELSEESWYFGFLPTNVKVQHNYWIRSVGSDTLRILKVLPGCGCTTAPLSKDIIPPGDSAKLELYFSTEKMMGKMIKEVTINCNDPQRPSVPVRFHAIVNYEHDSVRVSPRLVGFIDAEKNNYRTKKIVEILNNSKSDIALQIVDRPADYLDVMLSRNRLASGASCRVELRITERPGDARDLATSFTLEFSGSQTDRITVPVAATFRQ